MFKSLNRRAPGLGVAVPSVTIPAVQTSRRTWAPWLALGVIYVVWGSTYLAIRVLVREAPPLLAASLRFLVAGLVMAFLAARFEGPRAWPSSRQVRQYGLIGVLLLAVGNGFVMWAEQSVPSGIAALIVATVPLWMTLLDGLRPGGEAWTLRAWLGAAIGLGGVALVAQPEAAGPGATWTGVLGLQLAAFSWTVGSLYAQSLPEKLPLFSASAVEMLAGSAALLVESLAFGEHARRLLELSWSAWGALAYLVLFGSIVGFTAFAYCLNELPASTVGTYAYVNPAVAVLLGALILGEPVSAGLVGGGALILVAVLMTTWKRGPRRPAPQKLPGDREQAQ